MTPEQERQRSALRAYTRMPDFAVMPFLRNLLADLDAAEARAERAEADADTLAASLHFMIDEWGGDPYWIQEETGALAAHDEAVKQRP